MSIKRRKSHQSGRAPLLSPGRPSSASRTELQRFCSGIAQGMSSDNASVSAGMSAPVGARWFRKAGGMAPAMFRPSAKPLSGRYLSFVEREEIALFLVQGLSRQEIGRRLGRAASTISRELRRNAATAWSTERRPPNGMPSDQVGDLKPRSLLLTRLCAPMSRSG
jgi:hypothetical protein